MSRISGTLLGRIVWASSLLALLVGNGLVSFAQQPVEFVERYNRRFESRPPAVGQPMLDDLEAFDADGKPFVFSKLKGKHTVIVFGCLT